MMITLTESFTEFLLDLEADGCSQRTRDWYHARLKPLLIQFGNRELSWFSRVVLRDYVVGMRRGNLSPYTVKGNLNALHRFWSWANTGYAVINPMVGIKRPPMPPPSPKAVDGQDLLAMFKACPTTGLGVRDRAILIFLADTGIRAAGLRGLRVEDMNFTTRRATVTEKGGRSRIVPFTTLTAHLITQWLAVSPPSPFVFSTREGKQLTHAGLRQALRRLAEKAGVEGRSNPHSFRHFAAREYLTQKGDIARLSRLLGHSSIKTTVDYYTIFTDGETAAVHDQHSPVRSIFGVKESRSTI